MHPASAVRAHALAPLLWILVAVSGQQASAQVISPGAWTTAGADLALTRYSPLDQITRDNVRTLRPAWSFSTGSVRAHEGGPLVVENRMFLHTPFPNAVYALDLGRPGAPVVWKYEVPPAIARTTPPVTCCDFASRGLAWHPSGKVYVPLLHGELAALDARTGREIWRVRNADVRLGATMPAAPVVVKDLVIVGTAGADFGVRGTLTAYEALTGRLVWRAFHTGPDSDVLIRGEANALYRAYRAPDLGVSSWPGDAWLRGGATASGWISYDAELDLIYYGTDHPGTRNAAARPGANKWGATIFARSATTGFVRWALQLTPHDQWGYDASNENILVDLTIGNRPVKALVHFDRNGFAYTIDRTSGSLLVTERFGPVNWATHVEMHSAEPVVAPRFAQPRTTTTGVCPAATGAKGLEPAAYSPLTSLFYVPTSNLCMDLTTRAVTYSPGRSYAGATVTLKPTPGPGQGRLIAWNAATGAAAWQVQETHPLASGVLTTAGGLVFYGTLDGWIKAVDQEKGLELWRFKTPSGIVGSPITFLAPDGRQYLAVFSGLGGWLGPDADTAYPGVVHSPPVEGVLLVFGL